jgi:diacylglycerol kinase family enzyme
VKWVLLFEPKVTRVRTEHIVSFVKSNPGVNMAKKNNQVCLLLHKKSCSRPGVKKAIKSVQGKGIDISVRIPWGSKDQNAFIKQAAKEGITRFIAGGGDGTLNGVVNALMKKKRFRRISLGIMPLGTANDFARGAGLPLDDFESALFHAATAEATLIDIGQANKDYFINVASGGFGAEVTRGRAGCPREADWLARKLGLG